jgi:aspartate dehydrogenase
MAFHRKIALIGLGAITNHILSTLQAQNELHRVSGILDRPGRARILRTYEHPVRVVDDLGALLGMQPDIVMECAGRNAIREYGETILQSGMDLVVASVGALADEPLAQTLESAANDGGQLLVPSGAVAGIDGLLAARTAGLKRVTYTSSKPPAAWKDTPAEQILNLDAQSSAVTFFDGTARKAAAQFPKNANVGATVALAGIGLDETRVRLMTDPALNAPLGIIEAEGDFGRFRFEALAFASPSNPKTSVLTAHSMLLAVNAGWAFRPFHFPSGGRI